MSEHYVLKLRILYQVHRVYDSNERREGKKSGRKKLAFRMPRYEVEGPCCRDLIYLPLFDSTLVSASLESHVAD